MIESSGEREGDRARGAAERERDREFVGLGRCDRE